MAKERTLIRIDLLPAEQKLLLKYAYPFEPEKEQLKSMIPKGEVGTLLIRPYFLSLLLGDLCHSMTERAKGRTVDRLIELYQRLEYVEMIGDGTLDAL